MNLKNTPTPNAPDAGRCILIVDDDESALRMIEDMLKIHAHQVVVARDGQEAIILAKTEKPDLIFMDLRLPKLDGYETTKRLRQFPEFSAIPIIALTASVDSESIQKCLDAGCTAHLAKPVQSDELLNAVKKYLRTE